MQRLVAGDRSTLGPLFDHYRDRLWRMVHFRIDPRLQGRVDADDILQEAYLDAEKRLDAWLADERSFFVWLRLVIAQTMVDVHRRHLGAKMRDVGLEVSLAGGPSPSVNSASLSAHLLGSLTSPSQAAMREELHQELQNALNEMDPMDREVLVLRHFEELSNRETAQVLGIRENAASNRYIRALTRLRGLLSRIEDLHRD